MTRFHDKCGARQVYRVLTVQLLPFVRPTALALSCAAEAHVPRRCGAMVAAHTAGQRREICNQRDAAQVLFGPGGSAAGPKPGRNGFSDELGGLSSCVCSP